MAALVIFLANAGLAAALIAYKRTNRRRSERHRSRKRQYLRLLSRHIRYQNCTDPITPEIAGDPAFLEAVIEIRNALSGPELASLDDILETHGVVEQQGRRLGSSTWLGPRLAAAAALAELGGSSSGPLLMEMMQDPEPEIRILGARGLARIGWTPAIEAIVSRFGRQSPWVRTRFADALTGFGKQATWPLVAYVRVNHRHESEGPALAIRTLANIGDGEGVRPLTEIMATTPDLEVRLAAIEALGVLGNPVALGAVHAMFGSGEWEVRAKCAGALGRIGSPRSIPLLSSAMEDPNWWVRRNAAAALARIPGGIETLYAKLGSHDRFAADAAREALVDAGQGARLPSGEEREKAPT